MAPFQGADIRSRHGVKKPTKKILGALRKVGRSGIRYGLHSLRNLRGLRFPRRRELRYLFRRDSRSRSRSLANVEQEMQDGVAECDVEHKIVEQERQDGVAEFNVEHKMQDVIAEPMLSRSVTDPRVSNMKHFYMPTNYNRVPHGDFTQVRRLATGINGDIFKYRWCKRQGVEDVAVKMVRNRELQRAEDEETNEHIVHLWPSTGRRSLEDARTEIGVMTYLSAKKDLPRYILALHDVFADIHFTWVVLEFADGGELFDVADSGGASEEQTRMYMWQLLQAVFYLHKHRIGHRDISLENVLLKGNEVRLMDFGMAVRSHSDSGTPLRFFHPVGKDFYRAPECYVPRSETALVEVPGSALPGEVVMVSTNDGFLCEVCLPDDAVPRQRCEADVWGYRAHPADIFSIGICFFILGFLCPAWSIARLYDGAFNLVHSNGDKGIARLLERYNKKPMSPEAMQLLVGMLHTDPAQRYAVAECLSGEWFAKDPQFSTACVPVHHL